MFTRLVVALDGSPLAESSLDIAAAIARAADADLDLVCVSPSRAATALDAPSGSVNAVPPEEYLRNISDRVVCTGMERVFHTSLSGPSDTAICAHAKRTGADLMLVASGARTGGQQSGARSLADALVDHSQIPVLVFQHAAFNESAASHNTFIRRVLVPLDGSAIAAAVMAPAVALAASLSAKLHLLRVVRPVLSATATRRVAVVSPKPASQDDRSVACSDIDETAREVQHAEAALAAIARSVEETHAASVSTHVLRDFDVAGAIVAFSLAQHCDLVVLSSQGQGMSELPVGRVASRILAHSTLPVLTLHRTVSEPAFPNLTRAEVLRELPSFCGL